MIPILDCAKLCIRLYFENGLPIKGMPEKCFCGETVDNKTPEPLPITLHLPKEKKPEPEREDDRAKVVYDAD